MARNHSPVVTPSARKLSTRIVSTLVELGIMGMVGGVFFFLLLLLMEMLQ
jgi:hypothetical protein